MRMKFLKSEAKKCVFFCFLEKRLQTLMGTKVGDFFPRFENAFQTQFGFWKRFLSAIPDAISLVGICKAATTQTYRIDMMDTIQEIIQRIRTSSTSDPQGLVNFKGMFKKSVTVILWTLINGEKCSQNDIYFQSLSKALDETFHQKKKSFQIQF